MLKGYLEKRRITSEMQSHSCLPLSQPKNLLLLGNINLSLQRWSLVMAS